MHAVIQSRLPEVTALCRTLGVRRLSLFGSAVREDFGADSDVDVLVELAPITPVGYAAAYFDLKSGLEEIFGRPVDLVTEGSLRNPYLREHIAAESVRVFEA